MQFDVLEYRLNNEYHVEISKHALPHKYVRWVEMDDFDDQKLKTSMDAMLVYSEKEQPVLLFQYEWSIKQTLDKNKGMQLLETSSSFE